MHLRLTIAHNESPDSAKTYVFDQDVVTCGRAADNDVSLLDSSSVVSKYHAEFRQQGGEIVIEDKGSKNFTFVNGRRITAGQPKVLFAGDKIEIGPYQIMMEVEEAVQTAPVDLEHTVFAAGFANPFIDEAEALAQAFGKVRRAVFGSDYPRRDEALLEALQDALGPGGDAEVLHSIIRGEPMPKSDYAEQPPEPERPAPQGNVVYSIDPGWSEPAPEPEPTLPPVSAPPPYAPPAYSPPGFAEAPSDDLLHRLLSVITRLIGIPWQFRHEFVGHTILHSPETAFLYDEDASALLAYLNSGSDREERFQLLEEAAQQVIVHQVAMLDGYRAAVTSGSAHLLGAIDPEKDEAAAPSGGAVGRFLSAVKGDGDADQIRETVRGLREESASVLERRFFRPAFIDAYLVRLAGRTSTSPTPDNF